MARVSDGTEADELVSRMNAIRNVSEAHVADLHQQAQRLSDWREYVRAQPLLAVTAAAAVGYVLTRNTSCGEGRQPATSHSAEQQAKTAATAGFTSGAMAFVGSLASAALRQYALQKLQGLKHDRQ